MLSLPEKTFGPNEYDISIIGKIYEMMDTPLSHTLVKKLFIFKYRVDK
mgnify:CR=1 FL=1|jgi:hypothetical protein